MYAYEAISVFVDGLGLAHLSLDRAIMILIAIGLLYLGIVKKFEPLLLVPIGFGMVMANLPLAGLSAHDEGGLLWFFYQGITMVIFPPLIFLCIGALTDFGPLIANPKSALIGIGGQLGIFTAFMLALGVSRIMPGLDPFSLQEAAAIGIIGSSDGPTAIFLTVTLARDILPIIAVSAYSYMALVPVIQPPIMRLMTTPEERVVVMPEPKAITQRQKILFPIWMTIIIVLIVPAAGALLGMLMLGNLIRECGVVERYTRTLQNDFLNVLTLLLALAIGATSTADAILNLRTIVVILLGLLAFAFGTVGGVGIAKILYRTSGGKVNPLIGNAGVSAMPMAARVSQKVGQEYNPHNHLLMHAMGPIVSSTIGSAIVAGLFIAFLSADVCNVCGTVCGFVCNGYGGYRYGGY